MHRIQWYFMCKKYMFNDLLFQLNLEESEKSHKKELFEIEDKCEEDLSQLKASHSRELNRVAEDHDDAQEELRAKMLKSHQKVL